MTNTSSTNEIVAGVFLTQHSGIDGIDFFKLKWDFRNPIPDEDAPCDTCLHSDCRRCPEDFPFEERFVGIEE